MFRRTAEAKEQALENLNAAVSEAESLLQSAATAGEERAAAIRDKVEENLRIARDRLQDLEDALMTKGRAAVQYTDDYVHDHPWQILGAAIAIGVGIGILLNRR